MGGHFGGSGHSFGGGFSSGHSHSHHGSFSIAAASTTPLLLHSTSMSSSRNDTRDVEIWQNDTDMGEMLPHSDHIIFDVQALFHQKRKTHEYALKPGAADLLRDFLEKKWNIAIIAYTAEQVQSFSQLLEAAKLSASRMKFLVVAVVPQYKANIYQEYCCNNALEKDRPPVFVYCSRRPFLPDSKIPVMHRISPDREDKPLTPDDPRCDTYEGLRAYYHNYENYTAWRAQADTWRQAGKPSTGEISLALAGGLSGGGCIMAGAVLLGLSMTPLGSALLVGGFVLLIIVLAVTCHRSAKHIAQAPILADAPGFSPGNKP